MRELSEVMGGAFEARASSMSDLTPGARLATVKAQVRRRRVTRHALEGAASLAVVGALVVAGWFGLGDRNGPPPVATPTPSPTSSPSPDPTPEVTETPEVVLGDPITETGLPSYYAMPDGLLAEAGPGWVLATYFPRAWSDELAWNPPGEVEPVYLVDPSGNRFEVTRLDPATATDGETTRWVERLVVSWTPGRTTAVVQEVEHVLEPYFEGQVERTGDSRFVTLDLVSGELSRFAGTLPSRLTEHLMESPDGTLAVRDGDVVIRTDTGEVVGSVGTSASGWCEVVTWWTADTLLAACIDEDPAVTEAAVLDSSPRLVTFDATRLATDDGTLVRALSAGDVWPWNWDWFDAPGSGYLADETVVVQGTELEPGATLGMMCATGAYMFDGEESDRIPVVSDQAGPPANLFVTRGIGGSAYVEAMGGCSGDSTPSVLVRHDPSSGQDVELVGLPVDAVERWYTQGLTSWLVGE